MPSQVRPSLYSVAGQIPIGRDPHHEQLRHLPSTSPATNPVYLLDICHGRSPLSFYSSSLDQSPESSRGRARAQSPPALTSLHPRLESPDLLLTFIFLTHIQTQAFTILHRVPSSESDWEHPSTTDQPSPLSVSSDPESASSPPQQLHTSRSRTSSSFSVPREDRNPSTSLRPSRTVTSDQPLNHLSALHHLLNHCLRPFLPTCAQRRLVVAPILVELE